MVIFSIFSKSGKKVEKVETIFCQTVLDIGKKSEDQGKKSKRSGKKVKIRKKKKKIGKKSKRLGKKVKKYLFIFLSRFFTL